MPEVFKDKIQGSSSHKRTQLPGGKKMKLTLMAATLLFWAALSAIPAFSQERQTNEGLTRNLHGVTVGGVLPLRNGAGVAQPQPAPVFQPPPPPGTSVP